MVFRKRRKIIPAKTPGELDAMQAAGEIVGKALQAVKAAATAGVSTLDLDKVAEDVIRGAGATPTFQGYQGFPASICVSINTEIVHGIPNDRTHVRTGDLVSIEWGIPRGGLVLAVRKP